MIETTNINEESLARIVPDESWLRDYIETVRGARFPLSLHLLSGIFALTTIVGRRARLRRAGYRLYPPTWVLLLGSSGVGKGKSLWLAKAIVEKAMEGTPFLLHTPDTFTRRGLIRAATELIQNHSLESLEGAIFIDEISSVLQKRTGTENMSQFFIKASDMGDVEDMQGMLGVTRIQNFTVGFACSTPIDLLRESVTASIFSGGLMHRFLIAHEIFKPNTTEVEPDRDALDALAQRARSIRDNAPRDLQVAEDADALLRRLSRRAESAAYPSMRLAGFWNRFDGLCAKVAVAIALSCGRYKIELDDVMRGERLIHGHLYPPLVALVKELSYGPHKQMLFHAADDLYCRGSTGMAREEFQKILPAATPAQVRDQFAFLRQLGMLHEGMGPGGAAWCWRMPEWVK